MGVPVLSIPVLSMAGDRLLAPRESMLRALGMNEWIAASETDSLSLSLRHAGSI
ncbi:MAG: hypothetical protein N838_32770 [Thiohalocapsa sp. PB-PSB1]|jgi:predicted O-linked N-acetylglucosamine transferase (SPINDLY family)|nr:MAG: hypothetical protein N838_32770 [Thiohalocapsa sp. PB-PSB1]